MSKKRSEEINSQIKALGTEIKAIYEEHKEQPTGDALKAVTEKRGRMNELHTEYLAAKSWEDGIDATEEHLKRIGEPARAGGDFRSGGDRNTGVKTIADMVLEDEGFKSWFVKKATEGGPHGQFRSPSVTSLSLKTLIAASVNTGAMIRTEYDTDVMLPYRPLNVRDLVTIGTTDSDLVTYTQQTTRTNNAAVTPEATATIGSSGTSPESGLGYVAATAAVQDITTWVPATRQALADAGQLRTLIDSELT